METKITLLRKKREINKPLKVKIGDDITKLSQGLLNRRIFYLSTSSVIGF